MASLCDCRVDKNMALWAFDLREFAFTLCFDEVGNGDRSPSPISQNSGGMVSGQNFVRDEGLCRNSSSQSTDTVSMQQSPTSGSAQRNDKVWGNLREFILEPFEFRKVLGLKVLSDLA